ncbi:ThiF family adenylyltransferase [Psychrobacillus sp. NPDC058041]|uniref:ThiF family adenylyltransferase n=1 Tax=Psychrobacillus sp. NPDC058041 TaxID=3346310 RepID=UPI0036DED020
MIRFKPYIRVLLNEKEKKVIMSRPLKDGDGGDIFELTPLGLKVIKNLNESISKENLIKKINVVSQEEMIEMDEILELLINEKYIGFEFDEISKEHEELEKVYGRVIPLWAEVETEVSNRYQIQEQIMNKKVGIIGCGTIGMGIISKLVTVGINKFILIDDDLVSRTNLTRQPAFLLSDIDKSKTTVAKQYIYDRIENPQVEVYNKRIRNIDDLSIFNDVDIIIVASDEPKIDKLVQEYGNNTNITLSFTGGYTGSTGKIFPIVIPGKTHDYNCIHEYLHKVYEKHTKGYIDLNTNNNFTISSITSVADFIVSISSFEIIKCLTGVIEPYLINKIIFFNFANYTIDELNIENVECNCINNLVSVGSKEEKN